MILAAGRGMRLRPLTDAVPKPLVEVAGRPMIAFALDLVRAAGIEDVVVNLHHLGDLIRTRLGDGSEFGVRIRYSVEDPVLETGGGIAAARALLGGDRFVVLNSDTYCELSLREPIRAHIEHGALATLVLRPDPDGLRRDDVGIDAGGRVRRFLGENYAAAAEPLRRCMYAGIMVLEPRIFDYLPPAGVYSITRDVFPRLLAAGEKLHGYVYDGYWQVLDTPADLETGRREIPARRGAGKCRLT